MSITITAESYGKVVKKKVSSEVKKLNSRLKWKIPRIRYFKIQ